MAAPAPATATHQQHPPQPAADADLHALSRLSSSAPNAATSQPPSASRTPPVSATAPADTPRTSTQPTPQAPIPPLPTDLSHSHSHTPQPPRHYPSYHEPHTLGIHDSIAQAPDPKPGDFMPPRLGEDDADEVFDLDALKGQVDDDIPGSPTAKLMRVIAPQQAVQQVPVWPQPPPNASVNLFIGRALLSHGNDNWPLKPNDIVNWIRKHYPSEWDGDEGRCSAHRVRTYLARKGADMYYEKLTQGSIAGWRIRQNHLWRFENGGFQGRGMKQEEAIANAQKESEMVAAAGRKAAAAEALAAGHPGVKVSMGSPGMVADSSSNGAGVPQPKRPRLKAPVIKKRQFGKRDEIPGFAHLGMEALQGDFSFQPAPASQQSQHQQQPQEEELDQQSLYSTLEQAAGPSSQVHHADGNGQYNPLHEEHNTLNFDESGIPSSSHHNIPSAGGDEDPNSVDINMVQQAMQAAAGQMDDLEMGMQLPIEMQMHSAEHDDEQRDYEYSANGYGYNG
ncbi:hypothetical protein L198_02691 [Cryptococcus wingfieldii CBS 7118]|uniref:Uncharacterized protein n=1 Tax=Cryptococcus wingfieldii CBS 7118 TaxID=1295528 RepID=A0A1E3JM76_9TREE|nr:hypothetical protein L198_02691 [Cryptococcus wingfieldii CBS 7118]ODO01960.1 hypothetical protein L198_02691 [Cryptococcus wingfieldii CBS 7118]